MKQKTISLPPASVKPISVKLLLLLPAFILPMTTVWAKNPEFTLKPVSIPIGEGLPENRPIDIAGFHTGMSYQKTQQVLSDKGLTKKIRPQYFKQKMPYAKDGWMSSMYYSRREGGSQHKVKLIFSSNASANELYGIYRITYFDKGQEASVADYIKAIEEKYGKPSAVRESSALTYYYAYDKGQQKFNENAYGLCNSSVNTTSTELTYPSFHNKKYQLAQALVRNDKDTNHCSAYMKISFGFRYEANGQKNKNFAKYVAVSFIDADRMYKSFLRDVSAMKELKDKASKATRPSNPTKPSL